MLPGLFVTDTLRQYLTQLRQELGIRLCELVYPDNGPASKVCRSYVLSLSKVMAFDLSALPLSLVVDELLQEEVHEQELVKTAL